MIDQQSTHVGRVELFTFHDSAVYKFSPRATDDGMTRVYRKDCSLLIQNGGLAGILYGPHAEFDSTAAFVELIWQQ